MSHKKKEIEFDPDAEKWVADEDARFEAEVAAQSDDDARADARKRQAELEEEQRMEWEHSQGPEGDEEGHPDEG